MAENVFDRISQNEIEKKFDDIQKSRFNKVFNKKYIKIMEELTESANKN
ncbi:MAG: hypothetical protein QXG00_01925 [Candidatus Woesearchaeota archaeon]